MATLVLTAVGTAVGGPIGGAIGAILGQQIDQAVFKPAARQGPRLTDLSVQSSSYGAQIPRLFGRTRVAGTVVWATDLVETRKRQSNGKGRASTDTYSYSASFAVLLSARPIAGIGRIWADGNLLRGAGGDLKVETLLRVHTGDADAAPDPLIAAAEAGAVPAWRGAAYAVFEAMQLGDYGNRIPSLSFEVIADDAPVAVGTMLAEVAGVAAEAGRTVTGFAATGGSVRAVIETIATAFPLSVRDEADGVHLRFAPVPQAAIDPMSLGTRAGQGSAPRLALDIAPLDASPIATTIAYFDGARDYQAGLQRARREGAGVRETRIDLPATIDASDARTLIESALARQTTERTRATVTLPWQAITLRPGDAVTVGDGVWRVSEVRFEHMVVTLDLVRIGVAPVMNAAASPGRILAQVDAPHGPTALAVIDLPPLSDVVAAHGQVAVFAAGTSRGWRRALLLASIDGGATFDAAGSTALPATMGATTTLLSPASPDLVDRVNTVDVALLNPGMTLFDADEDRLAGGANRAMIGDEMFQFGRAVPLGDARYRLSELWRGRRGSEAAIVPHAAGTRFVLVDPDAMALLAPDQAVPGVIVMASSIGDAEPYPQSSSPQADRSVMPLSPVALSATRLASGDTQIAWTRRSRSGWAWRDGVDAPLAEEREAYRIVRTVAGKQIVEETTEPAFVYPAAARAADAAVAATAYFTVVQIGATAVSDPAALTVALN